MTTAQGQQLGDLTHFVFSNDTIREGSTAIKPHFNS
jgi:hypothetical protein